MELHPRRIALLALTLAGLAATSASAAPSTRHVTTSGTDTGACVANPCRTITYAVGQATAGDTIQIGPGTFAESVAVTKDLTFIGAGTGSSAGFDPKTQTSVDAGATPSPAFSTTGPAVTLRNLRIRGGIGATDLPAAVLANGATLPHVTIVGCVVLQSTPAVTPKSWSAAVSASPQSAVVSISDSTITGYESGVAVGPSTSGALAITRSTVKAALFVPPDGTSTEIIRINGPIDGVSTEVPTTVTDSAITATSGIDALDASVAVTRSAIRGMSDGVALINSSPPAKALTMRDSTVAPAAGELDTGILAASGMGAEAIPVNVALTGDSILALSSNPARGLDATHAATGSNVSVRNTVLRAIDPAAGAGLDIAAPASPLNWAVDHSAYTTAAGAGVPAPGTATNLAIAVQFADSVLGDLHLPVGSPLADKGDPSAVAPGETDRDGNARAADRDCDGLAQPDIGAYELPAMACPPRIAPLAPIVTVTPALGEIGLGNARFAPKPLVPIHSARSKRPRGTTLRFTLNETATVTAAIQVAVHRRHHPTTFSTLGTLTFRSQRAGADRQTLSGRINGRALARGPYRLTVTATDAAHHVSTAHHLAFTIVAAH